MKLFTHPPEVYWRAYYRKRRKSLRKIPAEEQTCLNCGTQYRGNYCPVCGQSHRAKSLTILHVLRNFWISLITLRRGYALTLIELTGHPGYFIRHYIKGHRIPYVHPFRLLLVLLAIYTLLSLTFFPEILPKEQTFGFMTLLKSVNTGDWRQELAGHLLIVLQYIHDTPMLQMAASRFEDWFFQNPAFQALTFFPFFALLSYTLFHSGGAGKEEENLGKEAKEKTPGIFETTIKEPLRPLWNLLHIVHIKVKTWIGRKKEVGATWWVRNFGKPTGVLKACKLMKGTYLQSVAFVHKLIQECKPSPVTYKPFRYDFIEVLYMRGYFTCLLVEVNLILFFWGITVTPFNPWVIAGTVWIYKHFFRWRWWDTIKRTCWMYVLTVLLAGIFCMITSITDVIKE